MLSQVLRSQGIEFQVPTARSDFSVSERQPGNATTDFGVPVIVMDMEREPLDRAEFERLRSVLLACWQASDHAAQQAAGRELQKGPRGGGRELEQIWLQ